MSWRLRRLVVTCKLGLPLLVLAATLLAALGCVCAGDTVPGAGPAGPSGNLLQNRTPIRSEGVLHVDRLTDGITAENGDHWKTDLTAVFRSSNSFVEYDLGSIFEIDAAFVQADNNDIYDLVVSQDGKTYGRLWQARPVRTPGLQPRYQHGLKSNARYVRLSPLKGDGAYTVTELQLFSKKPAVFPPRLTAVKGIHPDEPLRSKIVLFGVALALLALLAHQRSRRRWTILLTLLPMAAGYELWQALANAWPIETREVSLFRSMLAAVTGLVVIREVFAPRRFLADHRVTIGVLSITAPLSLACFFNLGRPQFHDHKHDTPSVIHSFDMRVYYPVAKYFKELRYDGLYQASVAAYVDDVPGQSLQSLANVELRDLRTHRMRRVAEVAGEIEAVERRFSPERWETFKQDMRYFRETMGVGDYLGSMHDHGANSTPVWFMVTHLIFTPTVANNATLLVAGALDPLLLLFTFVVIGRTFGLRTMLVSMVVFGANDFYMFGSNWAGATLRHDWMAALGLGLCAIKRERWVLAGALLAWGALVRAFPALALGGLAVPALWWIKEHRDAHGKLPALGTLRLHQRPVERVALGAAVCVAALFLLSVAILGFGAWPEWLRKISLLAQGPHVNQVSLRALVAYSPETTLEALANAPPGTPHWSALQSQVLKSRIVLFVTLIATYLMVVVIAARKKRLEHAAILGLFLIPVIFNPANYYAHFIFLIPLLGVELQREKEGSPPERPLGRLDAAVWITILAVCFAQYWTVLARHVDMHFVYASALLMTGLSVILVLAIVRDSVVASPAPAPVAGPAEAAAETAAEKEPLAAAEEAAPEEKPEDGAKPRAVPPEPEDEPPVSATRPPGQEETARAKEEKPVDATQPQKEDET